MQNKTVVTNAFKGEDLNKYVPVFQHHDIPVKFNFRERTCTGRSTSRSAKMLVLDKIFPDGIKIPDYFHGKNIVHLPTMKCHIYTTTTGAMKNAFGGLLSTNRHYTHSHIHETLVDLLAIQKEIHTGIFAHDGRHHRRQRPRPAHHGADARRTSSSRSGDQVAIDAVAAKMMGFDPMSHRVHPHRARAGPRRRRPARDRDRRRRCVAQESWGFKVGGHLHSFLGWLAWYGPTKVLQKVDHCTRRSSPSPIMFSEVFHDYYHWPLKEKKVYERWREESPWGHLFAKYDAEGAQAPSTALTASAAA